MSSEIYIHAYVVSKITAVEIKDKIDFVLQKIRS